MRASIILHAVMLEPSLTSADTPAESGATSAGSVMELNKWLQRQPPRVCRLHSVQVDDQGGLLAVLSNDGVHFNCDGYAKMHALALQAVSM